MLSSSTLADEGGFMKATWYGAWHHGKTMANGKPFDMYDPSIVAHRSFPLGTVLRVKNTANGKVRVVTVQDRGPFNKKDASVALDLSHAAAEHLGYIDQGKALLLVTVIRLG